MSNDSSFVFLTTCADISEAQVIKSFLEAQGFHPFLRDEKTQGVAPHLSQFLGKITLEIPENEFPAASQALEKAEQAAKEESAVTPPPPAFNLQHTQQMAKKALWNALLGCILIPLFCNFYSMLLGYRVLKTEVPLSSVSKRRILWAILFNSLAFYIWLSIGPSYFFASGR
ncbi:MAG: DUF2007 domain-containing protein [Bdellovibrio sp.]